MRVDVAVILHRIHPSMVRLASDTCYVNAGTVIMCLGVPSKLKVCISKVDRYTTPPPYHPSPGGITFKTSAYAHDARDVMSVCLCACACCKDVVGVLILNPNPLK